MDSIVISLVVQVIFELAIAAIPWEFSHHINNNWEKLHKDQANSLERMFLHHGRVVGDVIIDAKKFLGEFQHQNDTNLIMSCELEIA